MTEPDENRQDEDERPIRRRRSRRPRPAEVGIEPLEEGDGVSGGASTSRAGSRAKAGLSVDAAADREDRARIPQGAMMPPPPPPGAGRGPRGAVVVLGFLACLAVFLGGAAFERFYGTRLFGGETARARSAAFRAKDEQSRRMITAVQAVSGAVVGIVTPARLGEAGLVHRDLYPFDSPDSTEDPRVHLGSGVICAAEGSWALVATAAEVVSGAGELVVVARVEGVLREYRAEIAGADSFTGLALLRVFGTDGALRPARWADSGDAQVGEAVVAVGNPFGLGVTAVEGIISSVDAAGLKTPFGRFIQISARVDRAVAGGPLVDMDGRVAGITLPRKARMAEKTTASFAVPADFARDKLETLRKMGRIPHSYLGVTCRSASEDRLRELGISGFAAAVISHVARGSPAHYGDLARGDTIFEVDGRRFRSLDEFQKRIQDAGPRKRIQLSLFRARTRLRYEITLGELRSGK